VDMQLLDAFCVFCMWVFVCLTCTVHFVCGCLCAETAVVFSPKAHIEGSVIAGSLSSKFVRQYQVIHKMGSDVLIFLMFETQYGLPTLLHLFGFEN
jgi:hypothetical protein